MLDNSNKNGIGRSRTQVNFPNFQVVDIVLAQILERVKAFKSTKKAAANYDNKNNSNIYDRTSESYASAASSHCD